MDGDKLDEIISEYQDLIISFRNLISRGDVMKSTLNEYQHRFLDIKTKLLPFKNHVNSRWLRVDDKAATAKKARIAVALTRGEIDGYGTLSMNQANNFAASTREYEEFLEQRAFYRESLTNIDDVRNDISAYVNLCKDYLKDIH